MRRNTLKGWIPTTGLALVLTFGVTFANAGTVINNRPTNETCSAAIDKGFAETIKHIIKVIIGADTGESETCSYDGTVINNGAVTNPGTVINN